MDYRRNIDTDFVPLSSDFAKRMKVRIYTQKIGFIVVSGIEGFERHLISLYQNLFRLYFLPELQYAIEIFPDKQSISIMLAFDLTPAASSGDQLETFFSETVTNMVNVLDMRLENIFEQPVARKSINFNQDSEGQTLVLDFQFDNMGFDELKDFIRANI